MEENKNYFVNEKEEEEIAFYYPNKQILNKPITPEIVREFLYPTNYFLCPLSANIYNIKFLNFRVRDVDSGKVFYEI